MKRRQSTFDPEIDKCWIEWRVIHGMYELQLYSPNYPTPIGLVWCMPAGRGNTNNPQATILHAYMVEWARRSKWIFEAWTGPDTVQRITTPDASAHGGLEAMKRLGYKHVKAADCWVLTRDAFFRKKK